VLLDSIRIDRLITAYDFAYKHGIGKGRKLSIFINRLRDKNLENFVIKEAIL